MCRTSAWWAFDEDGERTPLNSKKMKQRCLYHLKELTVRSGEDGPYTIPIPDGYVAEQDSLL